MCEEEITLAPQTEIFEEAKRIAAESAGAATDSFVMKYGLGELADIIGNKPHFYNEIFDFCANNSKYRIYIQLNNGDSYFIADLI